MRYRLPRPVIPQEILPIIRREVRKQRLVVPRMTKKNLREFARICKEIEERGCPQNLVCKKLEGNLGRGMFLRLDAEPILKGQVIGSYSGILSIVAQNKDDEGSYAFAPIEDFHLTREEQLLFDPKSSYHPRRLYALKLDALKKGNFTRFINHSDKPNVYADMPYIPSNSYGLFKAPVEIIYMAKKTIRPGEQLLVSYEDGEKSYWTGSNRPFAMTPRTFKLGQL